MGPVGRVPSKIWEPWDQYRLVPPTFMTGCYFSDFWGLKLHKISNAPDPAGGAYSYSTPPDPLAGFEGATYKGRNGKEGEREREGREGAVMGTG